MTHTISSKIKLSAKWFADCEAVAQFARRSPKTAVVFVHGFGGGAEVTWKRFPAIIQEGTIASFAETDFYFFGYDSLKTSAADSGEQLELFLNRVMTAPGDLMEKNLKSFLNRSEDFQFRNLVVVAHSLGAIVSRFALICAQDHGSGWFDQAHLILFAPAHMGARARNLLLDIAIPIPDLNIIAGLARYFILTIDELDKDSKLIAGIKQNAARILNEKPDCCLKADAVVQGKYERVVYTEIFLEDPRWYNPKPARSHMHVQTPDKNYTLPVEILESVLKRI